MKRSMLMLALTRVGAVALVLLIAAFAGATPATPLAPQGATLTPSPTFSWLEGSNASGYTIWVDPLPYHDDGSMLRKYYSRGSICPGNGTCSVTPSKVFAQDTYLYWIITNRSDDSEEWSGAAVFSVQPPPAPTLTSPTGGVLTPTPTYTWQKISGATSYVLLVDTAPWQTATRMVTQGVPVSACGVSSCSVTPAVSLPVGNYNFYVAAIGATGQGPYGGPMGFSVQAPPAPTLVSPTGGVLTPTPTYTWQAITGATSYALIVDTAPWQTATRVVTQNVPASACVASTCAAAPGVVLPIGNYNFYVAAISSAGQGPYGGPMGFSVQPPPPPTLVSPSGVLLTPSPNYTWQPVAGATSYELIVDTAPWQTATRVLTQSHPASVCSATACTVNAGVDLPIGNYNWYVAAVGSAGKGTYGGPMGITIQGLPAPTQLSPSGAIETLTPTYTWTPVNGAVSYILTVNDDQPATQVRQSVAASVACHDGVCSATPAVTLVGRMHTWYVQSHNGAGDGPSSPGINFMPPGWAQGTRCPGTTIAADFNGDGKTDKLCSTAYETNVALSTGDGFQAPTAWLNQPAYTSMVADFNGDGKADLLRYQVDNNGARTFSVALSTGTGFTPFTPWGEATAGGQSCEYHSTQGIGNFDGNGLPDVWCHSNVGMTIFVGLNTGSGFVFRLWGNDSCGSYPNTRSGPSDFDGDGRDDWSCISGLGDVQVQLSNGQAFEDPSGFLVPFARECAQSDYTFVDLNGDGKTDVTCRNNGFVALSTGAAFLYTGSGGGWCDFYNSDGSPRSTMQPMDIDGDGLPELVCAYAGSSGREVHVRRWTGTTLAPPSLLTFEFCTPDPSGGSSIIGGDFDGDGKGELVCDGGAILTAGPRNVVPDLVVQSQNELGGKVTVAYAPSSQFASDNNPGVQQVVTSMTTLDGRGGSATMNYVYAGARVDRVEGMNLGFRTVRTIAPCLAGESSCPPVITTFSQELRSRGMPILSQRKDGLCRRSPGTAVFLLAKERRFIIRAAGAWGVIR